MITIAKETLLHYAIRGRGFQVPDIVIGAPAPNQTMLTIPDSYIHYIKIVNSGNAPAAPVYGYTSLSSVGFVAFKKDIKKAYAPKPGAPNGWKAFEAYAKNHFAIIAINKQKEIVKTQALLSAHKTNGEARKAKLAQNKLNYLLNFVV